MVDDNRISGAGSDVISIARCRELLGREADDLSDENVDRLRLHADAMAHTLIDIFLTDRATQHRATQPHNGTPQRLASRRQRA